MLTHLQVTRTEDRSPTMRRLWFRSDDLSAFAGSEHTDRYVKLVFSRPGVTLPTDVDIRQLRRVLPPGERPTVRTYTALYPDVAAGTLAIDFVVHGDEGVAGPWARNAEPGDTLLLSGPGGGYSPDRTADWHLIAGDEAALPAITAALEALAADSITRTFVLVDSPAHRVDLPRDVQWVYRPDSLIQHIEAMDWLPGRVHGFVHGEGSEIMKQIRPHLLNDRGLPKADLSISGYWRRGRTEEGFREWKSALAEAEAS